MNTAATALTGSGFGGLVLAVSLVVTLINCFFGYKMQPLWMGLICFLVGFIGGFAVCTFVVQGVSTAIATLVGSALGVLLALLSWKLSGVGVFLFAAATTFWTGQLLFYQPAWLGGVIGVLAGLFVGFLAVKFTRSVMILATGITGGLAACKSLLLLVPVAAVSENVWLPYVGGAALAVLGIAAQWRADMRQRKQRREREEAKAARAAARAQTGSLPQSVVEAARMSAQSDRRAPAPLPLDITPPADDAPPQDS